MEATFFYLLMPQKHINSINTNNSEIKRYLLCLGNILKDFTSDNMKKNQDQTDMSTIFLLIIILLILLVLSAFIKNCIIENNVSNY